MTHTEGRCEVTTLVELLMEAALELDQAQDNQTSTWEVNWLPGLSSLSMVVHAEAVYMNEGAAPANSHHKKLLEVLGNALQELDTADVDEALADLAIYHKNARQN